MAEQWYYTEKGKEMGPVPTAELKRMATSGSLKPTDMVWQEDLPTWVRAATIKGLFPEAGAITARSGPTAARSTNPTRRPRDAGEDDDPKPRRARRNPDYDDEEEDDDDRSVRRRKRRRRDTSGMPAGVVAALVVGGILGLLLIVGVVVYLVGGSGGNAPAMAGGALAPGVIMNYTVDVQVQGQDIRPITLVAGKRYEFSLKAANQAGDVDMYIMNQQGQDLAKDDGLAADAFIDFTAPYSGLFRIDIFNCGPMANQATVTVIDKGQSANPPNQVIERPINKVPPLNQPFPKPALKAPKLKLNQPGGAFIKTIPGDVFAFIKTAAADNRLADVDVTGFKIAPNTFRDIASDGGVLIGLALGTGTFVNRETINAVCPIYLTAQGEKMGAWHGPPPANPVILKAKAGYVVGSVQIRTGLVVNGLSLTFMKLTNGSLNLTDTEASNWVGATTGSIRSIGGQGVIFAGVSGHLNDQNAVCALGLVGVLEK